MQLSDFIPQTEIVIWSVLFSILAFENQRWQRAISSGMRGANNLVPFFAVSSGVIGILLIIFIYGWIFFYGSWQLALGLMIINFLRE